MKRNQNPAAGPANVEILSRRLILDDFFKVEEAKLRHERFDGEWSPVVRRLSLDRGDAVAAVLVRPHLSTAILVRQFRYPVWGSGDGWLTELVAGICDRDESREEALRRETLEETGYHLGRVEPVMRFYVSPGGSTERISLYCGEIDESTPKQGGGGEASEGEDIELIEKPFADLWEMLDRGEIVDAKTIIGLQWLRARQTAGV